MLLLHDICQSWEQTLHVLITFDPGINMRSFTAVVAVAGLLLGHAIAQTSTFFSPGVPTDAPIPGNYTGPYRPRVHFSPPQNFMNDPNGMFVDANGTWHLYYQYDPTGIVAGNQHWGHAVSHFKSCRALQTLTFSKDLNRPLPLGEPKDRSLDAQ